MKLHREIIRSPFIGVIGLSIVAGIVLRWISLGFESLWFDEGYTAWVVTQPILQVLRAISVDTSPPFYYLLLKGWTNLFGNDEAALRAMSAAMGTASLFLVYQFSREIFRDGLAVAIATVLSAVSLLQIRYAREARFYEMTGLLVILQLYLVVRYLREGKRSTFAAIVGVMAASLYTNNVMFFYLAAVNVAWLVWPSELSSQNVRRRVRDVLIASVIAGVFYLPWLPIFYDQTQHVQENFWTSSPTWRDFLIVLASVFGVGDNANEWAVRAILVFVVGVLILGIFSAGEEEPSPRPSPRVLGEGERKSLRMIFGFAAIVIGPVIAAYFYSLVRQSIFMERIFVASAAVGPLLMAACVASVRNKRARIFAIVFTAAIAGMSTISTAYFFRGPHKEQWRDAIAEVLDHPSRGRLIVFVANEGELLFDFYADQREGSRMIEAKLGLPQGFFQLDPPRTMQRIRSDENIALLVEAVESGKHPRVTLMLSHADWADGDDRVLKFLRARMKEKDRKDFVGVSVIEFVSQDAIR